MTHDIQDNIRTEIEDNNIPKLIFIVPYRDREQQLIFFNNHMKNTVMSNKSDYSIYYVEQCDKRDFNRGAMKNIGFLAMKEKYPNDYQNITFVFNDIDTMPFSSNFLNYYTTRGVIKHFYGYMFALGGIVSITGVDFEKIKGFPNFWAWGYEDNLIQKRAINSNIIIDRSQFYPIMDKNIIQLKDGLMRVVNRNEFDRFVANTNDGIMSIKDLKYTIDEVSGKIKVTYFLTETENTPNLNILHDLRTGSKPFKIQNTVRPFIVENAERNVVFSQGTVINRRELGDLNVKRFKKTGSKMGMFIA